MLDVNVGIYAAIVINNANTIYTLVLEHTLQLSWEERNWSICNVTVSNDDSNDDDDDDCGIKLVVVKDAPSNNSKLELDNVMNARIVASSPNAKE
jgi:hypothetical protein